MGSQTDDLIERARDRAAGYTGAGLSARPTRGVALVTCMDARIYPSRVFGLTDGEAHVVRNAGGVITSDVIRSLAVSQQELGTEEVIIIQHAGCGMMMITDDGFRDKMEATAGVRPDWPVGAFSDLDMNLRASIGLVRDSPFLVRSRSVRGFVFDIESGTLREVAGPPPAPRQRSEEPQGRPSAR